MPDERQAVLLIALLVMLAGGFLAGFVAGVHFAAPVRDWLGAISASAAGFGVAFGGTALGVALLRRSRHGAGNGA